MSDLQYEFYRNSGGNYLVFHMKQLSDGYIRKMLAAQKLPFLLEETIVRMDCECELHYRISGMRTMERRYAKQKMRTAEIVSLLDQLIRLRDACAAHLLPDTHLFLTPDLIYLPHMGNESRFLYLPEKETSFEVQMQALADFMMKHVSYERSEDAGVELVYALQDAAGRDGFDLKLWMAAHRPKTEPGPTADRFRVLSDDSDIYGDIGTFCKESPAEYAPAEGAPAAGDDRSDSAYSHSGTGDTWFEQIAEPIGADTFEVVSLTDDWDMKWKDDFGGKEEHKGAAAAAAEFLLKDIGPGKKNKEKKDRVHGSAREEKRKKKNKRKEEKASGRDDREERILKQPADHESARRQKIRGWFRTAGQQDSWDEDDAAAFPFPYEEIHDEALSGRQDCSDGRMPADETVCLSDAEPYASERKAAQTLHVLIPMNGGSQIQLDGAFFLIGASARHTDITLSDPTVSRVHAEIFSDETGIWIEDCNSRNGTLVDGQLLGTNEPKRLETGMHIQMGRSEFVFR